MQTPDNSLPFLIKDIAVLELAEEVDLTVYTPICLPRVGVTEEGQLNIYLDSMDHKKYAILPGTGSVYGWGSTGGASAGDCTPAASFPDLLQEAQMRVCTPQETMDPNTGQSVLEDYQICFRSIGQTGAAAYRVRRKCSVIKGKG